MFYLLNQKKNKVSRFKLNEKYTDIKKFIFIIENKYLSFRKTKRYLIFFPQYKLFKIGFPNSHWVI